MTASARSAGILRSAGASSPALAAFLALILVQGVHEIEHLVSPSSVSRADPDAKQAVRELRWARAAPRG